MAIARGGEVIASFGVQADERRSERLWIDVQALLDKAGMTISDVELFGVCTGPGNFTGLRVGISAVKGFAAATGKSLTGVTSLEAAACASTKTAAVCAIVNAYKGEVYSQLFELDDMRAPVALNEPLVSTLIEAVKRVAHLDEVAFIGDGAIDNADVIREVGRENMAAGKLKGAWHIEQAIEPVANRIARLAYLRFVRGEIGTAESLRACYVRPAEAEIKLSLGLLGTKIQRSIKAQ
jgi:tRNA threonylcarbamoyladenosine biosynthesis protein TsaB